MLDGVDSAPIFSQLIVEMEFITRSRITSNFPREFESILRIIQANCERCTDFEGDLCYPNHCIKSSGIAKNHLDQFLLRKNMTFEQLIKSFEQKQENIANLVSGDDQHIRVKNILEVGFNAGNSSLVMLLHAKASTCLTVVDLCAHSYTKPCFDYLRQKFGERIKLIEGDSTVVLKTMSKDSSRLESYDFIHIDGGHALTVASQDLSNAHLLLKRKGVILCDDTQDANLERLVRTFAEKNGYEILPLACSPTLAHMAIRKHGYTYVD